MRTQHGPKKPSAEEIIEKWISSRTRRSPLLRLLFLFGAWLPL